jgi:hypothetical protein
MIVDRFPLPPGAPPIGDTNLTHVMRLVVHSTTSRSRRYSDGTIILMTLYNSSDLGFNSIKIRSKT